MSSVQAWAVPREDTAGRYWLLMIGWHDDGRYAEHQVQTGLTDSQALHLLRRLRIELDGSMLHLSLGAETFEQ